MTHPSNLTLGDLITVLYDEFLAVYGDEEIASVAVAATINDLLVEGAASSRGDPAPIAQAA